MSTEASGSTDPTAENSTVANLPVDATRLGTDEDDLDVYYSRIRTAIYVADNDDIVFERHDITPGDVLVEYVDHISKNRGWKDLNLHDSFPDAFVAQLEEADA